MNGALVQGVAGELGEIVAQHTTPLSRVRSRMRGVAADLLSVIGACHVVVQDTGTC